MLNKLFFELIQVSIGRRDALSRVSSAKDWSALYGLSVKQAVAGVCFCGVQRLANEQREEMPKGLMMAVGVRQLAARYARAEKIPTGGTVDARMDGVSLCLEKN